MKVVEGQKVSRATVLGTMGTTGNSTGVHLHYQINNSNNTPINPCDHLGIPNAKGTYNSKDFQIRELYKDDKKIASWAKDAVYDLKELKIMNGDNVGNFNPTDNITRQEMAVLIDSLCDVKKYTFTVHADNEKYDDDADIASWAKTAVYNLKQAGIMSGKGSNKFDPTGYLTRQEAAVLVSGLIKKK